MDARTAVEKVEQEQEREERRAAHVKMKAGKLARIRWEKRQEKTQQTRGGGR